MQPVTKMKDNAADCQGGERNGDCGGGNPPVARRSIDAERAQIRFVVYDSELFGDVESKGVVAVSQHGAATGSSAARISPLPHSPSMELRSAYTRTPNRAVTKRGLLG